MYEIYLLKEKYLKVDKVSSFKEALIRTLAYFWANPQMYFIKDVDLDMMVCANDLWQDYGLVD